MKGWKEVTLIDYYDISSGLSKPASEFGKGFPFLSFKDVFWNFFVPNELKELVNTNEKEQLNCSVKKGDIFLTRTSEKADELGLSSVALKDYPTATFNGFTKRLRPKNINEIDPIFMGFYLRSPKFRADISAFSNLITRASLNNDAISRLKIFIPEIKTQKKIGTILFNYNKLIENNLKRIKLLIGSATIQYEVLKRSQTNSEEFNLNEIAQFLGRGVTPQYKEGSGFFAINQKANKGVFLEEQHFKEYQPGNWVPQEKYAKNGDVLINCLGEGTIGRCHLYKWEDDIFPVDQHMTIFRGNDKSISLYVFQFLSSEEGQGLLYSLKKGGTNMTMLNINDLRSLKICLPNENQLKKYYNTVEPLFAQKALLEKQNRFLMQSRDILLPRLINGEIEVK
jgi:type I restriction enzyme S subunit